SLAAVYASYAVTLVTRPLGSAIFGPYSDRHGRRRAMIVAVGDIGVVTGMMGLLSTIHQVGYLGPILFILLRVLQGIFSVVWRLPLTPLAPKLRHPRSAA